jgi:hypothetical protein
MLDADADRADLELRLISLSLKDRLIDLTACVAALVTSDACHPLTQSAYWHETDLPGRSDDVRSNASQRCAQALWQ